MISINNGKWIRVEIIRQSGIEIILPYALIACLSMLSYDLANVYYYESLRMSTDYNHIFNQHWTIYQKYSNMITWVIKLFLDCLREL